MKALIFIPLMLTMCGCGQLQREWTAWTGETTNKCSEAGTVIVQSDSGITMLLDRNGKTVPCGGK